MGFAVGMQLCVAATPRCLVVRLCVARDRSKAQAPALQTPRRQFSLLVDRNDPERTETTANAAGRTPARAKEENFFVAGCSSTIKLFLRRTLHRL